MKAPKILTCRQVLHGMMTTAYIVFALNVTIFLVVIVEISSLFGWNENQKQNILGIGLLGEVIAKLAGGRLSEVIGPRKLVGCTVFLAGILTIATPQIALWNYYALLVSRVTLGLLMGSMFPCSFRLGIKWFPPHDQAKFLASIEALHIGVAITNLASGFIISKLGWISVFYIFGSFSTLWSLLWFMLIYDTPEQHPRITIHEKIKIGQEITNSSQNVKKNFFDAPWRKILTSAPVWAILVADATHVFIGVGLIQELPSFMNQVLKLKVEEIAIYSSIPFLGKYFAALIFGGIADYWIKTQKFSKITIRRILESISLVVPSFCMILVALYGDNLSVTMPALVLSVVLNASSAAGHLANIFDVAPNYSGTVSGVIIGISGGSGYFPTPITALLLRTNHSLNEWQYLFWIFFGIGITGWIFYLSFSSSTLQSWDQVDRKENKQSRLPEA